MALAPPRPEMFASPAPSPAPAGGAASTASQVIAADTLNENRKLTIGDRLSYSIAEEKKPATDLVVMDSGEVDIPLIGRVPAAGRTCHELAASLKAPLEKSYFVKATVVVSLNMATLRSPGRVYVVGLVAAPGPQDIPAEEVYTLSKAITRAGGIAQFGNIRRVKIERKDRDGVPQNLEVDLGEIIYKGHIEKDPVLLPNDMIVVPRKLINF